MCKFAPVSGNFIAPYLARIVAFVHDEMRYFLATILTRGFKFSFFFLKRTEAPSKKEGKAL